MMTNRRWFLRVLALPFGGLALGGLAGCVGQIGSPAQEELGHDQHEMQVDTSALVDGWRPDGEWLVSPVLDAPEGATRVGVLLSLTEAGEMPAMEARPLAAGAPVGDWVPVGATWSEEEYHVGIAELGTMADAAQLRVASASAERLVQFRWNAVIPDTLDALDEPASADDVSASREALRSELSGMGIVTREAWGARATRCTSRNESKTKMAIHYTVTPSQNPERQVRGIQQYHMGSRGWCDVGYHFLVGVDGSIYEGRPLQLLGAHVGGNNTGNIGISFIGCFHPSGCQASWGPTHPPDAMLDAGGRLLGRLSSLYGISLDTSHVKGHRDHPGQSTSCPGDHLRARIGDMLAIGRGGSVTPAPPPPAPTPTPTPPSSGSSCRHSYGGTYADRGCSASWQCCDGSWASRGACGSCACTETTGTTGCSAPAAPAGPPAGASCTHSYGGGYANTACSAGYQCCNGSWRTRGSSGCGACYCVEETGTSGCGL
jgi:hypothetical protein